MVLPEVMREGFVEHILRAVLLGLDLLQDNSALAGNVVRTEQRIENQIAEHVKRQRKMLIEDNRAEANALFGRESIQMPADGVHLTRDLLRRPGLGSLK